MQPKSSRGRQTVAWLLAAVAFALVVYGFEVAPEWPRRIPLVTLPLYWFMTLSAWTYLLVEVALAVAAAWLVRRWVLWWFAAMDADRAARGR